MGRSKKNHHNSNTKSYNFSTIEKETLEAYLRYYYHAAHKTCFNQEDDEDDDETYHRNNCISASFETNTTTIGVIDFPPLTEDVVTQPYFVLPSTLESKHRRVVYDLCIHIGLYQTSIGEKFQNRRKVISIFADGLDYFNEEVEQENDGGGEGEGPLDHTKPLSIPIMKCKPWYFRNDIGSECPSPTSKFLGSPSSPSSTVDNAPTGRISNVYSFGPQFMSRHKVREQTNHYKEIIQKYMDTPHTCLRPDVDTISSLLEKQPQQPQQQPQQPPPQPPHESTTSARRTTIVDTTDKMKQCIHELITHPNLTELAFDLEAYNASKYKQATCLLQLCTNDEQEYVIDVLYPGIWDLVSQLKPIFHNPNIVKIGHGTSSIDMPCLHRDFGIFVINLFDTQEAAKVLGLKQKLGLVKLCAHYQLQSSDTLGHYTLLKENYQSCDWRMRPLQSDMLEYGLLDVRYLVMLRKFLISDLIHMDNEKKGIFTSRSKLFKHLNTTATTSSTLSVDSGSGNSYDLDNVLVHDSMDSKLMEASLDDSINDEYMNAIMDSTILEEDDEEENDDDDDDDGGGVDTPQEEVEDSNEQLEEELEEGYFTPDSEEESEFILDNDDDNNKEIDEEIHEQSDMDKLRTNELLMNTLRNSQRQCLSLWTDKAEVLEKNDTLVGLLRRAERLREERNNSNNNSASTSSFKKIWDRNDMQLYKDLFDWRNDVAKKVGISPAMMCTLDLLVLIAYARPTTVVEFRRINYFLPEFFHDEENEEHLEDMFSIVMAAGKDYQPISTYEIRYYSDCPFVQLRRKGKDVCDDEQQSSNIFKLCGFNLSMKWSAVIAGIAVFWIGISKRKT